MYTTEPFEDLNQHYNRYGRNRFTYTVTVFYSLLLVFTIHILVHNYNAMKAADKNKSLDTRKPESVTIFAEDAKIQNGDMDTTQKYMPFKNTDIKFHDYAGDDATIGRNSYQVTADSSGGCNPTTESSSGQRKAMSSSGSSTGNKFKSMAIVMLATYLALIFTSRL